MGSNLHPCETEDWVYPVSVNEWRVEQITVYIDGGHADVYITNSIVPIRIQEAIITVDVATIKEKASQEGEVYTDADFITAGPMDESFKTFLKDATVTPVYVETITGAVTNPETATTDLAIRNWFEIIAYDSEDTPIWRAYAHLGQLPMNFDPALKIPSGGYIKIRYHNGDEAEHTVAMSVIFRK